MNHNHWRSAAILVAGAILISTSFGADKVRGAGAAGTEKVTFSYGWGLLKTDENRVRVGFTVQPLTPDLESKVKAEKSFFMGVDESVGPMIEVMLAFKEGATTASLQNLDYYYIAFVNYKSGSMTVNLNPKSGDGKISSLSGDIKKGGIIKGVLKGGSVGMKETKFTWDLEFSTALRTP